MHTQKNFGLVLQGSLSLKNLQEIPRTAIIRQIVQSLEKGHLADAKTEDPELPGAGIEVRLRILKEAGHEPLTNLLRGLGQLNVPGLGVALDTDDSDNKGIISATADASVDAVARVHAYLTNQKFMPLKVTAPPEVGAKNDAASNSEVEKSEWPKLTEMPLPTADELFRADETKMESLRLDCA